MTQPLELDPVAIGQSLAKQREQGVMWASAWPIATGHWRVSLDDRSLYVFMERNFRDAYDDLPTTRGRCRVPEQDVSGAIVKGLLRLPAARTGTRRCRSGDDCPHPATHGRFGPTFCAPHAAELERISGRLSNGLPYNSSRAS